MWRIFVPDMTCEGCKSKIEEKLKELGFSQFRIDLEAKIVEVEGGEDTPNLSEVMGEIQKLGYSPEVA